MNKQQRQHSFESLFLQFASMSLLIILLLLSVIFYVIDASFLSMVTSVLIIFVPLVFYVWHVQNSFKTPLLGLSASLEAIRSEDYSLRAHPKFTAGAIKVLSDEVGLMADDLRIRKLHYDQQAVLVLKLIEQLATPIAVFDQFGRLNHANDAFSAWCGKPWKQAKLTSAKSLGLNFIVQKGQEAVEKSSWQIIDQNTSNQWQLRHSEFSMLGEQYQLVVLTNIEQVVYETEKLAWHKMTRVLSHEINNSLSPIKSLAQSLVEVFSQKSEDKATIEALDVIASRSDNLMQFVNRYASLNQRYDVQFKGVNLKNILEKVKALFEHQIVLVHCDINFQADPVLLEQVLINLIKNAIEASPKDKPVTVSAIASNKAVEIKIEDNGSGIANPDNLFVPFYTTKEQGKGIGLALSRNIVEQHGGRLSLRNKEASTGAEAAIRFTT